MLIRHLSAGVVVSTTEKNKERKKKSLHLLARTNFAACDGI